MSVVEALASAPQRVKSGNDALKYDGVGYNMSRKIQEILDTGNLKELDTLLADPDIIAMNELCSVYGIGAAKARQLLGAGIKSIKELNNAKEPLNHKQTLGLKYLADFKKEIPRNEVEKHVSYLIKSLHRIDNSLHIECTGSYRRGEKTSKDIDIMISHPNYLHQNDEHSTNLLGSISKYLTEENYMTDLIGTGSHQIIGVVNLPGKPHRKFEVKLYPMDSYYTGLLHFTGTVEFNRQMRKIAKLRGFKLSEYYLSPRHSLLLNRKASKDYKVGKPLPLKSEKEIFDALQIPYREPKDRSI
jgi:DNA polymerase beta